MLKQPMNTDKQCLEAGASYFISVPKVGLVDKTVNTNPVNPVKKFSVSLFVLCVFAGNHILNAKSQRRKDY